MPSLSVPPARIGRPALMPAVAPRRPSGPWWTTRARAAALPLALLLVAGCSLQPKMPVVPLPAPESYRAAVDAPADGEVRAVDIGWRSFFTDPRLQQLIDRAIEHNRDYREAVLRIEEARANYRIQRADLLPTVAVGGSVNRSRNPTFFAGSGTGVAPDSTITTYELSANIPAFEIDFWGRVRSLRDAALASYLATEEAARAFRLSLISDVASTYLIQRELEERIGLARQTADSRSKSLRIAKLRFDAGVTSALDYRQSELLLRQAEIELAALERQSAQNQTLLLVLVGGSLGELPKPAALGNQGIVQNIAAGLPSDLLVNRPDILAAEQQLAAANANIGAARAAFLPNISLTGAFGFASFALDSLLDSDSQAWSYGASLTQPIFEAGRLRASLDLTEIRRDISVANYERTIQTAFREVADALAARRWLSAQIDAQALALAAQRDRARLAELRYNNGVASYIEVLDAQRELFDSEQTLVQLRRQQLENAVLLYVALGGGLNS